MVSKAEEIEKFYCECKKKYHFYNNGNGVICGVCKLPVREEYIREHLLQKEYVVTTQLKLTTK